MAIKTLLPDNRTDFEEAVDLTGVWASDLAVRIPQPVRPYEIPEVLKVFKDDLIDLSKRVPVALAGLGEIAAAAGQSGIGEAEILKFTEGASKAAVAFDKPAGEVGESLAKIKTGMRLTLD